MELRYYIRGDWKSICSNDIRIFKEGSWIPIVAGNNVRTNLSWFQITCPLIPNEPQNQDFTKEGCGAGTYPSVVNYSVPAATYYANTLDAANALALADIAANGQAYADAHGICFLSSEVGVIVVDFEDAPPLDIFAYLDTTGIDPSVNRQISYTGFNFLPYTGTISTAKDCYILASDKRAPNPVYRFEFNVGKLMVEYPSINNFIWKIQARADSSGTLNMHYAIQGAGQGQMGMANDGLYIPNVTGAGFVSPESTTPAVGAGRNGVYDIATGAVIATFNYNRTTKALTVT